MSRILRLQAESFKRLKVVDIAPDGNVVRIRGKNEQGKSSVLDAIFAVFGGAAAAPVMPVRDGEEYAIIRADLGELHATRYFDKDGTTTLKVETADGARYGSGQAALDALVGKLSFDPLAFAKMDPKAQAAELRRLVKLDVDLDELAKADKADYDARRDVNRDGAAVKTRLAAIVVPEGLPDEEPDRDAILGELSKAGDHNTAVAREADRRQDRDDEAAAAEGYARKLRTDAADLRKRADEMDAGAVGKDEDAAAIRAELAALPAIEEPIDVSAVRARLAEVETILNGIRRRNERAMLKAEFETLKGNSEALTKAMADRAELREKALRDAKMPVEGLSFATFDDELHVTFEGVPFSQASSARQLRVSTLLAMSANPKLRVLRIKEGSLLDEDGMQILADMAAEHDFQIWAEFVGEGDGVGFIMEEGEVRGAEAPERVDPPKKRAKKADGETGEKTVAHIGNLRVEVTDDDTPETIAAKLAPHAPAKAKPKAMREFVTSPAGGLFGDDK